MPETAVGFVEQQQWLDRVADPLTEVVRGAYSAGGEAGRRLKNAAHGTWLGHPLHPVLTDIPLGAWTTSLVLDATEDCTGDRGYGRAADVAIGFGLVGAVGAAVTGLTDWSDTSGPPKRVGLVHGILNLTATTLYASALAMRRGGARGAGRAFSLGGFLVACTAAYLGGQMVYEDRLGVTHAAAHADEDGDQKFTRVLASSELADGEKKKVEADGADVVIARQHGRACALVEQCAHLGGPLSEGTLKDGSIVCPWHGSEFSLCTGEVINGPATQPQPRFDVREQNNTIEVRRA